MTYLVLIDRCYRGTVEAQFFDPFYGVLGLRAQVGAVDVVLRGDAVTAAVDPGPGAGGLVLRLGGAERDPVPDPRESVRAMLAAGITTYADEPGLRALGLDATALLPGVICLDSTELAARWADYDGVWFL